MKVYLPSLISAIALLLRSVPLAEASNVFFNPWQLPALAIPRQFVSQSTLAKIRTGQDGLGYSQSYLHMLLDATADYSKFQVPNFKKTARGTGLPLTVKVNSIAT